MPQQGQYTAADLAPSPQPAQQTKGQFTAADLDSSQQSSPSGFLSGLYDSVAGTAKALYHGFVDKPTEGTLFDKGIDAQTAEGAKALDNAKQGRYSEAAGHGLAAVVPGFGPAAAKAGEDIGSGNTGYGLGEASGLIAQAMAPEAAEKVPAGRIASTIGKVGKGVLEDLPVARQVGKVAKYWKETAPSAAEPVNPGAPLPEAPTDELRQAAALFNGSSSPADPAAGLGTIKQSNVQPGQAGQLAESMQKPAEVAPGFQRGSLQELLDQSLGAKKLEPNVPLRNQMDVKPSASADASSSGIPAGHTAVDSTAMKSYKYDPAAREFEIHANGNTYTYGDVDPQDAKAFQASPSKGQAWAQIKRNPLVRKNGVPVRVSGKSGDLGQAMDSQ